jgi:hypothetical protein
MFKKLLCVVLSISLAMGLFSVGGFRSHALNTTYYVSFSDGNDYNNGLSMATPWKTLARVTGTTFLPGDNILLKCGDTWTGQTLLLNGNGTASNPIVLSSYGTGNKPVISPGFTDSICIYGTGVSGWKITGLELCNAKDGIRLDYVGVTGKDYFWIENCYIHDLTDTYNSIPTRYNHFSTGISLNTCSYVPASNSSIISPNADALTNLTARNIDFFNVNASWSTGAPYSYADNWKFESTGNGYYFIKNTRSGKYLKRDLDNGGPTTVSEQSFSGNVDQRWNCFVNSDNFLYIWNLNGNQALTLNNDGSLVCGSMDWDYYTSRSKFLTYNNVIANGLQMKLTITAGLSVKTEQICNQDGFSKYLHYTFSYLDIDDLNVINGGQFGLFFGFTKNSTITNCDTYNTGYFPCPYGSAGIIAGHSNNLVFDGCDISYARRHANQSWDGVGFDFEGGVDSHDITYKNATISHTDGAGIMLYDNGRGAGFGTINAIIDNVKVNNFGENPGNSSSALKFFQNCGSGIVKNSVFNRSIVDRLFTDGNYADFTFTNNVNADVISSSKAVVSSTQATGYEASKAIDGDATTFWRADNSDMPSWLTVDLGSQHRITNIYQIFSDSSNWNFKLEISDDNNEWDTLIDNTGTSVSGSRFEYDVNAYGRYVRLYITGSSGHLATSSELAVYGRKVSNLSLFKSVSSSSSGDVPGNETTKAVDGNINTFWSTNGSVFPASLTVDLGSVYEIYKISQIFNNSDTWKFRIETSKDNTNWTIISDSTIDGVTGTLFTCDYDINARYVRLTVTESGGNWATSKEFEILGSPAPIEAIPSGVMDATITNIDTASWKLETASSGYYYIKNIYSGLYLTRSADDGNPSSVYEQTNLGGSGLQYWNVFVNTDGYLYIWDWFNQALTINTDNTISCTAMDWNLHTSRSKYFAYNPTVSTGMETKLTIEGGIAIQTGTARYTPIIQATGDTVTPQMRWQFVKDGTHTNYYRIKNVATGLFLTRNNDSSNGTLGDKAGTITEMDMINSNLQLWNIWSLYGVYNIWGVTATFTNAVDTDALGNQALTAYNGVVSWTNSSWVGGAYGLATEKVFNPFGQIDGAGVFGNGLITKLMPVSGEGFIKTSKGVILPNTSAYSLMDANDKKVTTTGTHPNFGYLSNINGLDYGISYSTAGDTISMPNINFGTLGAVKATIQATAASNGEKFELYLDNDYNTLVGTFNMPEANTSLDRTNAQTLIINIPTGITGLHTVNVKWTSPGTNFFSIVFEEDNIDFGPYVISGDYIKSIEPSQNRTVDSIASNIDFGISRSYVFKNGEVILGADDKAGTGTTLLIDGQATYTILIYGDITGDGDISITDMASIKESILNIYPLTGAKKDAADISRKGSVSISDLLAVKKHILGISNIEQ